MQMKYGLAVLIPPADTCTQVLEVAIKKGNPFAILMPLSLIKQARLDEKEKDKLWQAAKHILVDQNWSGS